MNFKWEYEKKIEKLEAEVKRLQGLYELELERVKKAEEQHWNALLEIKRLQGENEYLFARVDELRKDYWVVRCEQAEAEVKRLREGI